MAVYVVSRVAIADPERMQGYMAAAPATVATYGGRYVARSGNLQVLEGESCDRVVVLEFPTQEQALAWYNSPEYRPLRDVRWQSSTANIMLVMEPR